MGASFVSNSLWEFCRFCVWAHKRKVFSGSISGIEEICWSQWVTGLRLFDNSGIERRWHLKDVVAYKTGVVELLYGSQSSSSQP